MRLSRPVVIAVAALTTLSLANGAAAQQRQTPAAPAAEAAARNPAPAPAVPQLDAEETRRALEDVFKQSPPTLPRVLRMDPTLLVNDAYLQPYQQLGEFLRQHPEVAHNPNFFLAQFDSGNGYYRQTPQERSIDM